MKKPFYGWIILAAAIIGTLMSVPGQTVGVSVFTDFLIEAHSVTRSTVSLAYMIGTIASALLLAWAGRLYDRFGARRMGVPVVLLLALALLYLSFSDRIAESVSTLIGLPLPAVSFTLLVFGFFMIRFFGQGNLTMLSRNMVMKWFDRKRGVANAFLGISISLGFSASPGVVDRIIVQAGWRGAWQLMAGILAVFALLVFLVYRDNPAEMGLQPDGGTLDHTRHKENRLHKMIAHTGLKRLPSLPERDFPLKEARRTPVFWLLASTLALSALLVTAVTFHIVSIFEEAGIPRERAVTLFLPASVVAVLFQFIGSSISDYISERIFSLVQLIGLALLASVSYIQGTLAMQLLFIVGLGLAQGMMGITSAITWPRLFGLSHLGAITGFVTAFTVAGSAVGPFAYSLSLDIFGSYRGAGLLFLIIAGGLILFGILKSDFHPTRPG